MVRATIRMVRAVMRMLRATSRMLRATWAESCSEQSLKVATIFRASGRPFLNPKLMREISPMRA
eukprot:8335367-Pyramimonas_sp.AAC.1